MAGGFKRGYKSFGKRSGGKPEIPMEVMQKRKKGARVASGGLIAIHVVFDAEELTAAIGAASLCDYVSRGLLMHHADAIERGQRPSGGPQAPLDPDGEQGRQAAKGKRPSARGNRGRPGSLPPNLTRSAVRATGKVVRIGGGMLGFTARAEIYPAFAKQAEWIAKEEALGHEFFSVTGEADAVIEEIVVDYLATVFDGVRYYDPSKTKAGSG